MANQHEPKHDNHGGGHHLVPIPFYVYTLLALICLTVLTVAVSYVDLGKFNIVANLAIACTKATLVMLFFMGLRWDTTLNRAVIGSSFAALLIFISITASDLWTRAKPEPVAVKQAASSMSMADLPKYVQGSPELLAKGKELFQTNCAVCHGVEGKGDGAGGSSLNPKPRNFHADAGVWTHGNTAWSIYYTLAIGSPGTGMASYKSLLPEDRWALVHYVMSFGEGNARSGKTDAQGESTAKEELASATGPAKPKLPIDFAIERVAQ